MDFYQIETKLTKDGIEIYPDFKVGRSKDLMVRGKSFYAIWDEARHIWSTDEYDVQRLVDQDLENFKLKLQEKYPGTKIVIKRMANFSSNMWSNYRKFLNQMSDNAHQLDENLTFLNQEIKKTDYVSRRLPYPLEEGSHAAYDEIVGVLYDPDERAKLEWAIGSVISGDSKDIQKFIVLYGAAGTGKSTVLNIIQKLFSGYYTSFEAKALTSSSNAFSTEVFKSNPLVAIQHDGDLSKIEDNTKLNSIISHEEMIMNEKYKPSYSARSNAFLFMGTNKPVKITDAKSGIIRRLIDVRPSGNKLPNKRYHTLMSQIEFELGGIAWHCLQVYRSMGKNYYSSYRPLEMIFQTDVFFNFIEANYHIFKEQDGVSLNQAYEMYKTYCDEALVDFKLPRHKFREEMKSYFEKFTDVARIDGKQIRSYYSGFIYEKFTVKEKPVEESPYSLVLDNKSSIFDSLFADCPAQYATINETPEKKWSEVTTKLSDLDTYKLHYIKPPSNHIVVDFDLKDKSGKKSVELNLEAASKWPTTYAEFSKSGAGIHLHYKYDGDVRKLSRVYSEGIEIKVFTGQASLRRKFSMCNNSPIATINSGLPLKGEKMINFDTVKSEKGLRDLIARNLKKEIHPGTKPSIDFIYKILDDAYKSGMKYDVTDLRPKILAFANNSSHQAEYCIKLVNKMVFASEEPSETPGNYQSDELIFFDVEVFPNLFIVCWKAENKKPVKMINPSAKDIEELMKFKLVGFNCRRYDNHILYARYIGYDLYQLFQLSQKIINGSRNSMFGEAYNISYTDIYDFSSKKQSLKKFQIELGIHHQELGIPWDQEVPMELWDKVADYCCNDVVSEQVVFEDRKQDFIARLILSDLSGLTPNDTTQMHTAKIIFGNDKNPQDKFIYTDLSEQFPGYVFDNGKSTYRGEETGEGGYVYAEPGMYANVAVLDIASMHPTSLVQMNMFGPYTQNFKELLDARLAIKHKDYDTARKMLGGILTNYLTNDGDSGALSYALKIVINIVYGLTSAKFDNKFKDPRNKDNIVAKRGALFMIDLKHAVQEKGFQVVHIKTDSIKIPNATQEIIDFVFEFGKKYGYTFEHEETYSRFCLVNDAVYIARKQNGKWEAVGAQFAQPYVFKTLFSHEPIMFEDMCETKTVTSALYLDMNEGLGEDEHNYHFIGRAGSFCPVYDGSGGGILLREKEGKYYAATGTKGFRWLEAEMVKSLGREGDVNRNYYDALVDAAVEDISKYGDIEWFMSDLPDQIIEEKLIGFDETPLWCEALDFGMLPVVTEEKCGRCENYYFDEELGLPSCKENRDIPF
jgi:energy-coupling factor transporter ATP-binding protein EcfA2